jgi:hypothetical protein
MTCYDQSEVNKMGERRGKAKGKDIDQIMENN